MTSEERGVVYGCFNEGLKVNEIQAVWSRLISRDPLSNRQLYLYRERWVNAGRKNEIDETVVWSDRQAFARWHIQSSHLHMLNDIDNWLADSFILVLIRFERGARIAGRIGCLPVRHPVIFERYSLLLLAKRVRIYGSGAAFVIPPLEIRAKAREVSSRTN
jgi:hypothetical protein